MEERKLKLEVGASKSLGIRRTDRLRVDLDVGSGTRGNDIKAAVRTFASPPSIGETD